VRCAAGHLEVYECHQNEVAALETDEDCAGHGFHLWWRCMWRHLSHISSSVSSVVALHLVYVVAVHSLEGTRDCALRAVSVPQLPVRVVTPREELTAVEKRCRKGRPALDLVGFRVRGRGLRVAGCRCIRGSDFGIRDSGFGVRGSGFRVRGSGFGLWMRRIRPHGWLVRERMCACA
jgi:hypothetical protein